VTFLRDPKAFARARGWRLWNRKSLVFLVLCVFLLSGLIVQCRATSETDAQATVNAASQKIATCYEAAAKASRAGANVSSLLQNLTAAGNLLSNAELALEYGNFNSSYALALQSQQLLQGFETQAVSEQNAAARANYWGFMINIVGSLLGTVAVLAGSFAVWTWLKKRSSKRAR
jgi:hypothetical protein